MSSVHPTNLWTLKLRSQLIWKHSLYKTSHLIIKQSGRETLVQLPTQPYPPLSLGWNWISLVSFFFFSQTKFWTMSEYSKAFLWSLLIIRNAIAAGNIWAQRRKHFLKIVMFGRLVGFWIIGWVDNFSTAPFQDKFISMFMHCYNIFEFPKKYLWRLLKTSQSNPFVKTDKMTKY